MKKFVKNLAERIRMREISEVGYKEFSDYLNKMDDDEIIVKYGTEKELEIFFKIENNNKKQ